MGTPALIKRALKEEILKPRYREAHGSVVNTVLLEQGLAAQLCNSLYDQEVRARAIAREEGSGKESSARGANSPLPHPGSEELSAISMMLERWADQLHTTLANHCQDTGQPLMCVGEAGRGARSNRGAKFLYTIDDVLQLLESAQHPNHANARTGGRSWCLTPLELSTPRLPQLRHMFSELAPSERQSGLDDELRGWYAEERYTVGTRLLATGYAPMLRQFARTGIPAGLRGRVWLGALRLGPISERDYNYFAALQREVGRVTLATDEMVRRDAAAPAREEDFFVFAEMVEEILLAFCRDPLVGQRSSHPKPQSVLARNKAGQLAAFPPSGVPPGKGLADFVCPLCFVYAQPPELYFAFREMWMRYWCKLHALSPASGSLLPLLRLFEDLLQECAPAVCLHLLRLEIYPGRVALGWIASAFASFLPAEQTLILWDRIIGYVSRLAPRPSPRASASALSPQPRPSPALSVCVAGVARAVARPRRRYLRLPRALAAAGERARPRAAAAARRHRPQGGAAAAALPRGSQPAGRAAGERGVMATAKVQQSRL